MKAHEEDDALWVVILAEIAMNSCLVAWALVSSMSPPEELELYSTELRLAGAPSSSPVDEPSEARVEIDGDGNVFAGSAEPIGSVDDPVETLAAALKAALDSDTGLVQLLPDLSVTFGETEMVAAALEGRRVELVVRTPSAHHK